jgi:hypothetical protein
VIVVNDGGEDPRLVADPRVKLIHLPSSLGNCPARDIGIMQATTDAVLVVDAHCNWHADDHWADRIETHVRDHRTDIACCITGQLRPEEMRMDQVSGRYYACRLRPFGWYSCGRWGAWQPTWDAGDLPQRLATTGEAQEVACCMGGAYALSREWYINGLHRPWARARGWGCSEQAMCLPNWFVGGRNVILPIEIGHMFRTGRYNIVPYRTRLSHIYFNEIRLSRTLPLQAEFAARCEAWTRRNAMAPEVRAELDVLLEADTTFAHREVLERESTRTWDEYVSKWNINMEEARANEPKRR